MKIKWPVWVDLLPWRCLLVALSLSLGLGVAWAGWHHWRVADASLAAQYRLLSEARTQLAALQQRQQQSLRDAPLWHTAHQRGWLTAENRLAALDVLARLPHQPGVLHVRTQLGPRQPLSWPWPSAAPLLHSTLQIRMRLSHPHHLPAMLAPLVELPGLMLPTACQWQRQDATDAAVEGECLLAWVSVPAPAR